MTKQEAIEALRELGIDHPPPGLIENWLRAHQNEASTQLQSKQEPTGASKTEQGPSDTQRADQPHPSSKSTLKPTLLERRELQRPAGRRKPGRPTVIAPWFHALAVAMSDGTTLRRALSILGIYGLSAKDRRALYRNTALKAMREAERQRWLREFGVHTHKPRHRGAKTGPCKDGDCLGQTWQFRRML